MSEPDANKQTVPNKRRLRWFRFLYQFSLRTMLVGMTLAAVACWWFLQPPTQEEELAGQYLKLRRQVRVSGGPDSLTTDVAAVNVSQERTVTSVGKWRLFDENDDLLVDGRYENDLPQGKWALWHLNGQKAAEGDVFRGGRTGVWRAWDERGTLRSEVTYWAVAPKPPGLPRDWMRPYVNTVIPVVGMIGPVGQLAIGGGGPSPAMLRAQALAALRYESLRHGPCRVWYASGQLEFEGQYADDQRDGVWTYYDEQGSVVEKGPFKADLREGEWTHLAGTKPGPGAPGAGLLPAKVMYAAGRTQAEHDALLARLEKDLAGGSVRQQVAAATALEELGQAAVPVLIQALDAESPAARTLALRTLMRLEALHATLLPQIEPLASHTDPRLALRATLAVYTLAPSRRGELYPRLMALVEQSGSEDLEIEVLRTVCECDPDRQMLAFMTLVEMLTKRSNPIMQNPYLPIEWEPIRDLRTDPVPLLAAAFGHTDRDVRLYVLRVLELIVESGSAKSTTNPDGSILQTWPVPAAVQAVLDKAKNDPDPDVRSRGEMIGKQDFGGMGGGFF